MLQSAPQRVAGTADAGGGGAADAALVADNTAGYFGVHQLLGTRPKPYLVRIKRGVR